MGNVVENKWVNQKNKIISKDVLSSRKLEEKQNNFFYGTIINNTNLDIFYRPEEGDNSPVLLKKGVKVQADGFVAELRPDKLDFYVFKIPDFWDVTISENGIIAQRRLTALPSIPGLIMKSFGIDQIVKDPLGNQFIPTWISSKHFLANKVEYQYWVDTFKKAKEIQK